MATRTCPQCGAVNPAASKFCDACGINLTQRLQTTGRTIGATAAGPTGTPAAQPAGSAAAPPLAASGLQPGMALQPGMSLQHGRYVIDKALGKGGMGSIFLAHDTNLNNKPVVIKQMLPNYTTEVERVEAEQSFQEEMKTLASLTHPNIPNITDFFTESGSHFIIQEFISGEDLQRKLDVARSGGLPEKHVLGWISQALSVLDYLEQQDPQIIHRDIKPANIVVDAGNRARVVDFGVASHKFRVGTPQAGMNRASTAMGTPGYAPREQFEGNETVLSDLYALGATMHQLLTGRNPQGVEPLFSYPPVRQINAQVSEAAARIVNKALQNDPANRYQSAKAMKADVDAILAPRGALSTARGKAMALAFVLLALIAVGGGAVVYEKQQAVLPATGAVSYGLVAFDRDVTGRAQSAADPQAWATAKRDASVQWKNGNLSRAQALYQQAYANDQTDAESQIYNENAAILQSGRPYWVIGVGASFSGPKITSGRFALQGAYTAQHEINQNGGIAGRQLVLELANDASTTSGAEEAAKAIAQDDKALGFIGTSSSARTGAAIPPLTGAGMPIISPTSSNPSLNGSRFFFRICPSDTVQGQDLAAYAQQLMAGKARPTIAVFRDPNDRYSNGLANIFTTDVGTRAAVLLESYTVESGSAKGTPSSAFQTTLQGLPRKPDLIFFSGYASDALRLGQAMDALGDRTTPVLSDDAFYDPAEFIAYGAVYKGRYRFTGYFYPDQGSLFPKTSPGAIAISTMESEYAQNYHAAGKPLGYGFARVPSEAALFYDAVKLMAQAVGGAARGGAIDSAAPSVARARLRDAIATIRYQGMAGLVRFNQTPPSPTDPNALGIGDPIDKALLVLHLDALGHTHPDRILGAFQ